MLSVSHIKESAYQLLQSIDAKAVTRGETAIVYDDDMLLHENPWDADHIECPERLRRARERCDELGLLDKCKKLPSRIANDGEILRAHSGEHLQAASRV